MTTVALIGPDGAGKTTLARRLVDALGMPAAYLYMGINLESSNVMLPTTRLALEVKRRSGGRPDLSGWRDGGAIEGRRPSPGGSLKSLARVTNQIAEEWFRLAIATYHELRGRLVVFDRHFFIDYHAYDVTRWRDRRLPAARRVHGLMLARLYPRPDMVVMLDAPAEVLLERKGEGTIDTIDRRRREYLAVRGAVPRFAVVDATRPPDAVLDEIVSVIRSEFAAGVPT
jgi:thymidylate kinase